MPKIIIQKEEKGQVLVIMAVSLMVLLIFIGLAIDGTQLFLNYTRLKRAVDAAAIAAANDFKRGSSLARMNLAATEVLNLHQVDTTTVNVKVYMCDADGNGTRDAGLATEVPAFYAMCPASGLQKKLIYIRAYENSPTYFVRLVGIGSVPISTTAVAEAAPVDLVIVMDTSESMGNTTTGYSDDPANFNPAACNTANTCHPLREAKDAAKFLISTLYPGYDRVAIVTFDQVALTRFSFTGTDNGDVLNALAAVDSRVVLHDDPPANKMWASWNPNSNGGYNPVNPEDRDNNGSDDDSGTTSTQCNISVSGGDRWDSSKNIPCDNASYLDAFDWNQDGLFTTGTDGSGNCTASPATGDHCLSLKWQQDHTPTGLLTPQGNAISPALLPMSLVSTCSGCGIREATANLVGYGRSNAVWVMVFLSDGVANMSDTYQTYPYDATTQKGIPAIYKNGFCGGSLTAVIPGVPFNYWQTNCLKPDAYVATRYCINADWTTCPLTDPHQTIKPLTKPGSGFNPPYSPPYGPEDYARDMTDAAALTTSDNPNEKPGNDIAIYSIGFGALAAKGEPLLRYMAAVGDDGNRQTDPCSTIAAMTSCGQYYFAQNTNDLMAVFQDIASRIYTKISE